MTSIIEALLAQDANGVLPVALDNASVPWSEYILKYIVAPLLPVLGTLLAAALAKLVAYLHGKAQESKVALVGSFFAEAAQSIVHEIEVSLRPQIQKALEDGTLSPEEGAQLKNEALRILKTKVPATMLEAAKKLFGPLLDTWLGGLVERANSTMDAGKAAGSPS